MEVERLEAGLEEVEEDDGDVALFLRYAWVSTTCLR